MRRSGFQAAGKTRVGGSQRRPKDQQRQSPDSSPTGSRREAPAHRPDRGSPSRQPPPNPRARGPLTEEPPAPRARGPRSRPAGPPGAGPRKPPAAERLPLPDRPSSPDRPEPRERPPSPEALLAAYRPDISEALLGLSSPTYRYSQVFEHLLRRPLRPFSEATILPSDVRATLDTLGASTLAEVEARTAPDRTTKLLLSARDAKRLETVIMRYRERVTVCASSQVGCPVACLFCATGAMGLERNLTSAEIVDQVRACSAISGEEGRRISNLVYMGMGEPLLNLQAVLDSIRILTDSRGLGLAHRAISVSTIGIPSGIVRLARAEPQVNLAVSLHAADDQTRAFLVPQRFRHPLAEILAASWEHFALTRRKLLIEYVLLRSVNDSVEDARALAGLLKGHVVAVNLLNWNPVPRAGTHVAFQPSTPAAVSAFKDVLIAAHIETVVRQSKGASIQGACGQLAGRRGGSGGASSR